MANFEFLKEVKEYALFAEAAIEAERVYSTSPAMSAVGSRKALELAVKWVYSADNTMRMPYKDNLQSLIHEPSFRFAVDPNTWGKLPFIVKLGNLAVHTERSVSISDAVMSLRSLFEFVEWVDYCYGMNYVERHFSEEEIPKEKVIVDTKKIREQESLLGEKDAEIEKLRKQIEAMAEQFTASKDQNQKNRNFEAEDISEFLTRKKYIDVDLKQLGWKFQGNDADVWEEYEVDGMAGLVGQKGYVDYVLFGKDGLPLAIIEAKRTSKDPNIGRKQVLLYADCLQRRFGRRPMMFTTNGFETYFWDDETSPQRRVSEVFSKEDLQRLMNRRSERKPLHEIPINDKITDRYYQKEAIRAVCDHIEQGFRKNLLVMATGTGKTRTASSLTDVLSRGGYVTNVLFLADRTALVKQARDDFKNYLPDMSLCNLCSGKDDRTARIVFSTYPTMLNAIDECKTKDGTPLFTPTHFDLIIVDESHRSIFKKYRAIFEYFDAYLVGLTATPKTDVDRNTYDFFEMEHGIPTYAYDYETAVNEDHVLLYHLIPIVEEPKGVLMRDGENKGKSYEYICITRPRRFGKTVMANMIAAFFGKGQDSQDIFRKLEIHHHAHFNNHLNQHNVIYISFNELPRNCKSYQEYIDRIQNRFIKDLKKAYPNAEIEDDDAVWDALNNIYELVQADKFIFVMDEWDYIFHRDFVTEKDKKSYIDFLSNLLKDQPYVEMAYMTGILPIAKYSSGSELNMFCEYTMVNEEKYSEFFGFTESEVNGIYSRY